MKKIIAFTIVLSLICSISLFSFPSFATKSEAEIKSKDSLLLDAESVYLMEATSGAVLYYENELEERSPASVTKVMTLLLVAEALEKERIHLTDMVTVSADAASMGGSQIFLEEGERMSVEDLIKSTVIASANDAALALAEHTYGSENAFVKKMNARAAELGLKNTKFENTTGLDDTTTSHYTCARDIAVMSSELIKHDIITKYSSLWQDTIRNGEFTLTNTNRLVRYYDGCNGLKTGSTDKAGYCVSATAKRDGMQLIAVVMGAPSRDSRNASAKKLLDYGFANYALYKDDGGYVEDIPIKGGKLDSASAASNPFSVIVEKEKLSSVEKIYEIPEFLSAPVSEGEVIGRIIYKTEEEQLGYTDICITESVEKITLFDLFSRILSRILGL